MLRPALTAVLMSATLALAGCDSAEERAAKHFASAQALVAENDADRALVELRNVFKLDEDHKEARLLYARIQERRGDLADAAASYVRLVEQEPDNAPVHASLGRLAITLRDWDGAVRHATRAYEIDPAPALHRALYATVIYRTGDKGEALALARGVLDEDPANLLAHTVLVSSEMEAQNPAAALAQVDLALTEVPDDLGLHIVRLTLLEQLDRSDDLGRHLEDMVAWFPDQPAIEQNLIRWYIREGRTDQAEAALRARADQGGATEVLTLARFLLEVRDPQAALAELDARIPGAQDTARARFIRTRAAIAFEAGDRDGAIEDLRAAIADAPGTDETRISQVTLARMYASLEQEEEAAKLIEAVLAEDPDMVEALKIRAQRRIHADDTDGAIQDLRRALEQSPQDADILTLMAQAHEREGASELAGERLALAVQAAQNAKTESLRYANFLLRDDRVGPAESVVIDALRRAPEDVDLLALLARIHLIRQDYPRVAQTVAILEQLEGPQATAAANALRAQSLQAQARTDETIAFLEDLTATGADETRLQAAIPLIRAYMREGDLDKARGALDALEAEFPDHPVPALLRAGLAALGGDTGAAETIYRDLIARGAGGTQPWVTLYTLLRRENRGEEAAKLLDEGIAATDAPRLMLIKASVLERETKDFEGAIAIYEELYARDSSNQMIANNLASMISTHRTGDADLERAYTIARRLRGTEVPPFQDTYGWLLARRGDYEEALRYLRPAAAALGSDPLVVYHLGVAEAGAGNTEAARAALSAALSLGEGDPALTPQMEDARARIAALAASVAEDRDG